LNATTHNKCDDVYVTPHDVDEITKTKVDWQPVLLDHDDDAVITHHLLQRAEPFFGEHVKTCLHTASTKGSNVNLCCEKRSGNSSVQHIQQRGNWDCGFRNLQMILCALLPHLDASHMTFKHIPLRKPTPVVPRLRHIAESLEQAWAAGFDKKGAEHYSHKIVDRCSWIGAIEVATLLNFYGVDATVVQFINRPESRSLLPKFVKAYFAKVNGTDGCAFSSQGATSKSIVESLLDFASSHEKIGADKACSCQLIPLYLQWEGHSVTIVGIEEDDTFLVYDPAKNGQTLMSALITKSSLAPLRLNSIGWVTTKSLLTKDTQIILCTLLSLSEAQCPKDPNVITAALNAKEQKFGVC
jgi:hypothetical protein